jgi:hypothetical protein
MIAHFHMLIIMKINFNMYLKFLQNIKQFFAVI